MDINSNDFDLLLFYMNVLKLNTQGDIMQVRKTFNITNNKQLLGTLASMYNGGYYNDLYFKD